ncbi:MAG: hypothetical protein AAF579_23130 [Cyanobacteria bacterium P01_C01_bin.118]
MALPTPMTTVSDRRPLQIESRLNLQNLQNLQVLQLNLPHALLLPVMSTAYSVSIQTNHFFPAQRCSISML